MDSEAVVRCLRSKSEEEILALNKVFKIIPGVVDGAVLPRHPQELLASVNFHPVPSIIGVNNDEYGWIIPSSISTADSWKKMDRQTVQTVLQRRSERMRWPPVFSDLLIEII
ncbi:cocaine esterase-like [Nannospalax galili]|uniref:cocaine esterase-like n=1 Tax=Nannospalax galili TaxID=1026970 RepID=UPI00111BEFE3|nr:cocaine esterase-like [Nannospalax galili]